MSRKIILIFVLSAFLLTMCKSYASEPTTYTNGLTCQNYTNYRFFEWRGEEYNFYLQEEGAECSYTCPDGSASQADVSGTVSTLYSSSKEDLDAQLCGVAAEPTPTEVVATTTPTPEVSPTAEASPTAEPSLTPESTPTVALEPLLTGRVLMCDTGGNLINFRIVDAPPDVTGKTITAQIGDQESACYVNATNPSLLTCALPVGATFPAQIVVRVDGAVVNEFTYDGLGCAQITTPVATTTP